MRYTLGVDFGTSSTKVALRCGDEVPVPLRIGITGDSFMPSVVAYRRTPQDTAEPIAVGEDAVKVGNTDDTFVVQEVKRFLVSEELLPHLSEDRYPWWDHRDKCVHLWKSTFSPHHVALAILSEALDRAVRDARDRDVWANVDGVAIRGLPTRFGCSVIADLDTRRVLSDIARKLGFSGLRVEDIWEEPVLASVSYVHFEEITSGQIILIYDLGGGTFDTAVVEVSIDSSTGMPSMTVFSQAGEAPCGGSDIDENLFEYLASRLAEERLGLRGESIQQIVGLMSLSEQQMLRNHARTAKEILSSKEVTTIALAPGFLGEAGLEMELKREELERIVKDIGLLGTTCNCVLRAWRQARMWFRSEEEAPCGFDTEQEPTSGRRGKSVLQLGHKDLKDKVHRVLVVGGATQMPLIRSHLSSLWGEEKLIFDTDVVRPVESTAMGAAMQREAIGRIVDRLPFSVAISVEGVEQDLYRAFEPIVRFRGTLTLSPSVDDFVSTCWSLPVGCRTAKFVVRNADGEIEDEQEMSNVPQGNCHLRIDRFGRCFIKPVVGPDIELRSWQHPIQKILCERVAKERREQSEREKKRRDDNLNRPPYQGDW